MATLAADFIPRQFEATIDQEFRKGRFKRERTEQLDLKYMYPRHMVMKIPSMTLVCNPEQTWRYTPSIIKSEPAEVQIGKSEELCFSKYFDLLQYGLKDNQYYTVKRDLKNNSALLSLKDEKTLDGTKSLTLKFKKDSAKNPSFQDVSEILITRTTGADKETKYIIKDINTEVKFKSADFVFQIPENTKRL